MDVPIKKISGIALALLGGFFVSVSSGIYQLSSMDATYFCIGVHFLPYLVCVPLMTQSSIRNRESHQSINTFAFICLYGILSFTSVQVYFMGLDNLISVGDGLAVCGAFPIWTFIISRVWLKENYKRFEVVLVLLTVCGVVLVSRPSIIFGDQQNPHHENRVLGILLMLLSSVLTAFRITVSRKLGKSSSVSGQLAASSLATFIVLSVYIAFQPEIPFPCLIDVGFVMLSSLCHLIVTSTIILALRLDKPGPVAMAYSMQVPFGYIMDLVFFDLSPNLTSILGSLLVLSGTIGLAIIKMFSNSQNASS